eukprot:854364-Prymnesium_polylepis.1
MLSYTAHQRYASDSQRLRLKPLEEKQRRYVISGSKPNADPIQKRPMLLEWAVSAARGFAVGRCARVLAVGRYEQYGNISCLLRVAIAEKHSLELHK